MRAAVAATVLLLAAACDIGSLYSTDSANDRSPATGAASNPGHHIVQSGDSLSSIADRYGLGVQEIADANGMEVPYVLHKGQFLILPQLPVHEVRRDETLYGIARQYALDMNRLAVANGIGPPYTIYPGQILVLPPSAPPPATVAPAAPSGAPPAAQIVSAPLPDAPLPTSTPAPAPAAAASAGSNALPSPPPSLLAPNPRPSSLPAAALPPPTATRGFLWPVRGEILSSFGPNPGGLHNDGINIGAPRGTPVVAAKSGVVIFVGEEIEGFGKLLIIRHADGWSTAYGHNEVTLVERGDKVARGAVIARVGSTGDVPSPQLHFEIRRQTKAVDPMDHLA